MVRVPRGAECKNTNILGFRNHGRGRIQIKDALYR